MFYRFRSTFELDKDEKLKFYFSNGFNPAFVIQKMNGYDIITAFSQSSKMNPIESNWAIVSDNSNKEKTSIYRKTNNPQGYSTFY